ncbi:M23 family metallopeptidase [Bacillus methanolicus]|uniref:Peptidase M23 n=1 Tax=Bacillus methanolicus (strain MGA3 / ATCC 53907) TaxID=796606 RepID=I3ECW4_BACMM|nr:M23 family metallopeptidase [Bacillus methanolicus]AIE60897.1 Peptidase M23 [Bacillus methanolicus MGA3]EIJ84335.1 Peptidase M23 [Bacillus methanolicus MGA3]
MGSRADDIRKKIAKRKKERDRAARDFQNRFFLAEDEEKHGFEKLSSFEGGPEQEDHPLFQKEIIMLKTLFSACLVLIIAIIFRNPSQVLEPARHFVKNSMEKDFQFATVSDWYEKQFGKPLALLPFTDKSKKSQTESNQNYAFPASGRILEDFNTNGQRIMVETGKGAVVEAMNEGYVRFVGEKEGFGKTVIIKHADESESWYGNLKNINVVLYQYIEKGTPVGTVSEGKDEKKGAFYFAIKKGDDFIDPNQVIRFE